LIAVERETTAEIIRYLKEIDTRKLYQELGFSSLFAFCHAGLGYSEGSAYRRIQAARCIDETPEVLEKFESGALTLCAVGELSRVSAEKRVTLIPLSVGKSKQEVQRLVAAELPASLPLKEKVTAVNVATSSAEAELKSEVRYSVTLELTEEEMKVLSEVQALTGTGKESETVVRALKFYRKLRSPEERAKRRAARQKRKEVTATVAVKTAADSKAPMATTTRHVPVSLRDAVTIRDQHQCTFVGVNGHRCGETVGLQIDHIKPYSFGGEHSEENLRLLCARHNRFMFGRTVQ